MSALRKSCGQYGRLLGADTRDKHVFAVLNECGDDLAELVDRFSRPEDDFGEAAAAAAIEVDGGRSELGGLRRGVCCQYAADGSDEFIRRKRAVLQPLGERHQFLRVHPFSLPTERPRRQPPKSSRAKAPGSGTAAFDVAPEPLPGVVSPKCVTHAS